MLTKEQYSRKWVKLNEYAQKLAVEYKDDMATARKLYLERADKLHLQYKISKNGLIEVIHPNRLPEYQEMVVTKEVVVPREERQSSCDIAIVSKNFKDQMLSSINYTNNVNREVYYELCETPKGKKMTSATFGGSSSVSTPERKCQKEFGNCK